jgi:hypothetical protein
MNGLDLAFSSLIITAQWNKIHLIKLNNNLVLTYHRQYSVDKIPSVKYLPVIEIAPPNTMISQSNIKLATSKCKILRSGFKLVSANKTDVVKLQFLQN